MISDARGGHVSPGVYTEVRDVNYSTKSLGITTLGVAGETLKGPAFQRIPIGSWTDFTDYFGGTSPIKFKGTNYPKYELPYIAKAYLEESKQLEVVRVLGLSGYWAGRAWIVKANGTSTQEVETWHFDRDVTRKEVDNPQAEEELVESGRNLVSCVQISASSTTRRRTVDSKVYDYTTKISNVRHVTNDTLTNTIDMPVVVLRSKKEKSPVSGKTGVCEKYSNTWVDRVTNITVSDYVGKVYTADCVIAGSDVPVPAKATGTYNTECGVSVDLGKFALNITYDNGKEITYNVSMNPSDPDYLYKMFSEDPLVGTAPVYIEAVYDMAINKAMFNAAYNQSIDYSGGCKGQSGVVSADYSITDASGDKNYYDYISTYRCATTPWLVSEVKAASTECIDLKKLFRVYTISDGNAANYQVKISIQRIRPVEGLFDLVVRDFYDSDNSQVVLERYTNCSMVEGQSNFIGLKVGTIDGTYPTKSKYIALEFSDMEGIDDCVPCGFLGYPIPKYGTSTGISLDYNTLYDSNVKAKRQYFGLNESIIDYDILNYKGVDAYADDLGDADPDKLTNGFHLDSIITELEQGKGACPDKHIVKVDGVTGFNFTTVDSIQPVPYDKIPRILPTNYLDDCLYKDINLRKFTVYPYGGFDGWNINETERTNSNDYRGNIYTISSTTKSFENTEIFRRIGGNDELDLDPMVSLKLPNIAITTDYYAYLAGYMQFANPEDVDINLFATPGINYADQPLLTEDALDIIEDAEDGRGGDALYVMAAPQYRPDMSSYGVDEIVDFLDDTEIDTPYACTYWPWVKYWDGDNKRYIDLPATKDVVRDMAATDNVSFPWFSPAGLTRGEVECARAYYKTTLLDEDTLYENMVNPIKTFAVDGVKVWGNKTLYHQDTPRNRINVTRLMIRVKKLVSQAARFLIFEQYDMTLEKQFRSIVEPILQNVKENRGIYDYRIVTENTEETRDQHILPAKILIKPTPALEYISISFVVYPESVEFDDSL